MRKGISKAERRKAMRLAERYAGLLDSVSGQLATIPEFLDHGAYNAVYALSADLVLRIQRSAGAEDSSWDFLRGRAVVSVNVASDCEPGNSRGTSSPSWSAWTAHCTL